MNGLLSMMNACDDKKMRLIKMMVRMMMMMMMMMMLATMMVALVMRMRNMFLPAC